MVKRFFILLILISIPANAVKIEAVVNKEIITDTDISKRANMLKYVSPQARDKGTTELKKQALHELTIMSVKSQIASKNGVSVSDVDIKETKKKMFQGQKVVFPFDEREYDKNLKSQMMWARFVNGRFGPKVNITDTEVNEYLNQAESAGALSGSDKINLSQIQFIDKESADKTYASIKNIKSCLEFNNKADVGETGSGNVGEVSLSQMDKSVGSFLASSPMSTVLSPLKTQAGYSIFFICSKKRLSSKEKDSMKDQLKNSIVQQKAEVMGEKYLKDSMDEFYIDIKSEKYKEILNELH